MIVHLYHKLSKTQTITTMSKTVLITGASTGFGKLTAKKFETEGWNVVATMRSPEKEKDLNPSAKMLITELDVTKPETIAKAIQETISKFGTIDVLINNAGYGAIGPMMQFTLRK